MLSYQTIFVNGYENKELVQLIMKVLPAVIDAFKKARYIEINHHLMVIHE
jgi:hypothetical protein